MRLSHFSILSVLICACGCRPALAPGELALNIALPGPIASPDGRAVNGYETAVDEWIFEPVLRISQDGKTVPGLTSVVARLPKGELQLKIRAGAAFSDGTPVTVNDVAAAITADGIQARIEGDAIFVHSSARGLPADLLLPTVSVSKRVGDRQLGSGPFAVFEHDSHHLLLRRRTPEAGKINKIRLTSYDSPREAMARVLRGDANLLPQVQSRDVEFFEGVQHLKIVRGSDPHTIAICMNPQHLTIDERKAIARALPVAEVSNAAFGESCRPWSRGSKGGPIQPGRTIRIAAVDSDAELARLGLAVRRAMGERAGNLTESSAQDAMSSLLKGDYDLVALSPLTWPPGMASLMLHTDSPLNTFHYSNAAVDAAFEQGDWEKTLDALDADPPIIFLCTRERVVVVDARIKNPRLGPWGLLESLPDWDVGE